MQKNDRTAISWARLRRIQRSAGRHRSASARRTACPPPGSSLSHLPCSSRCRPHNLLHAGGPGASLNATAAARRWVAAISAVRSADRSAAKASQADHAGQVGGISGHASQRICWSDDRVTLLLQPLDDTVPAGRTREGTVHEHDRRVDLGLLRHQAFSGLPEVGDISVAHRAVRPLLKSRVRTHVVVLTTQRRDWSGRGRRNHPWETDTGLGSWSARLGLPALTDRVGHCRVSSSSPLIEANNHSARAA